MLNIVSKLLLTLNHHNVVDWLNRMLHSIMLLNMNVVQLTIEPHLSQPHIESLKTYIHIILKAIASLRHPFYFWTTRKLCLNLFEVNLNVCLWVGRFVVGQTQTQKSCSFKTQVKFTGWFKRTFSFESEINIWHSFKSKKHHFTSLKNLFKL